MERQWSIAGFLAAYIIFAGCMLGYWIEMAEYMEVRTVPAKAGKCLLLLVKWLVFPR